MSDEQSPLLQAQWRRMGRLGLQFWGIVLLVWIFVSWFLRTWLLNELYLSNALGAATDLLITPILFMLRIDLPLAILLQSYLWPRQEWLLMGPQLRLTMLSARQVAAARVVPTIIVLIVLNTVSAPFFYGEVVSVYRGLGFRYELHLGLVLAVGAWLEDLAFAVICVLCAALYMGDPTLSRAGATASAVGAVMLRGAAIALVATLHLVIQALLLMLPTLFGLFVSMDLEMALMTSHRWSCSCRSRPG